VAGIFVKAGNSPAAEFLGSLVDLDEKGQIKIDPGTNRTKTEGLFAAGDVTDAKYKQVVIAAGQGAAAALSADLYLQNSKFQGSNSK
jgi:Thioredoxin reductase